MCKNRVIIYLAIIVSLTVLKGCSEGKVKRIYNIEQNISRYANTGSCESYVKREGYYLCFGNPDSGKANIYNESSVILDTNIGSENIVIVYLNKNDKYKLIDANLEFLTNESDDLEFIKSKMDR